MRRKALEDNDSANEEDRDEADDGDWADQQDLPLLSTDNCQLITANQLLSTED